MTLEVQPINEQLGVAQAQSLEGGVESGGNWIQESRAFKRRFWEQSMHCWEKNPYDINH